MFSSLCKNFHVNKQRKNFKHWLLYDTTVDPFILFLKLEDIQEIEAHLEKLKEELIKHESGSSL